MSRKIELSTAGGGGPGAGWVARAELRPLNRGFVVWQLDADNRLRKVKTCSRPLSWREATKALRASSKIGLLAENADDGDTFFKGIYVDGVVPWQADMLRLAWVTYEKASDDVLKPLLKLPDDQIKKLWFALGSFVKPDALRKLRLFVNLQKTFGLVGVNLVKRIAKEIGLTKGPSIGTFVTTIDSVLERLEEARLEPFAAFIHETTERFSKSLETPRTFITGSIHLEKCDVVRKYLEDFVLRTGRQPKGKHEIPGVGKINLGFDSGSTSLKIASRRHITMKRSS